MCHDTESNACVLKSSKNVNAQSVKIEPTMVGATIGVTPNTTDVINSTNYLTVDKILSNYSLVQERQILPGHFTSRGAVAPSTGVMGATQPWNVTANVGGYDFSTRADAEAACKAEGYARLCTADEVQVAFPFTCSNGWTQEGWGLAFGVASAGCASHALQKPGAHSSNTGSKASAYCCGIQQPCDWLNTCAYMGAHWTQATSAQCGGNTQMCHNTNTNECKLRCDPHTYPNCEWSDNKCQEKPHYLQDLFSMLNYTPSPVFSGTFDRLDAAGNHMPWLKALDAIQGR